jgi:hypothetical protein
MERVCGGSAARAIPPHRPAKLAAMHRGRVSRVIEELGSGVRLPFVVKAVTRLPASIVRIYLETEKSQKSIRSGRPGVRLLQCEPATVAAATVQACYSCTVSAL